MIKMAVRLSGRTLETYNFSDQEIKIGRDSAGDVFLDNPAISRHHCTVVYVDEKLYIKDEGSANGTFLNGNQISGSMPVNNGDSIGIGKFTIIVGIGHVDKNKPVLNYGGGTLAIDASTVQKLKDAEAEAEAKISQKTEKPQETPVETKKEAPVKEMTKASEPHIPEEQPKSASQALNMKGSTQVFTQSMVKQINPIPYLLVGLLVGAAIGFVIGMVVANNMDSNNNDNKQSSYPIEE